MNVREHIGKLKGIYVGKQKGEPKAFVAAAELVVEHGLRGDSHASRDSGHEVSLFPMEVLGELQAEGFKVAAEELSANLLTENIKLNSLKPRTQLRVGETIIEIIEARKPCRSITQIDNRLPKRLYGQCGQFGRIVKGGTVRAGDEIEVLIGSNYN